MFFKGVARTFQRGGHRGYSPDCHVDIHAVHVWLNVTVLGWAVRVQWAGQAYKIYSSPKKTNFKEVSFSTMAFTAKTLSLSLPEYCRLFAQKKAYQGGVTDTPGPPSTPPPGFAPVFTEKCLNAWTSKAVAHSNWRQKRRSNDARMSFSLIYFFAPISIIFLHST